jgi:hypothetical protein
MDIKTVQQLQQDAKFAEGELRCQIQKKCEAAIEDILKSVGLDNLSICGKDISRLADKWHSNIMTLLEQINFIE